MCDILYPPMVKWRSFLLSHYVTHTMSHFSAKLVGLLALFYWCTRQKSGNSWQKDVIFLMMR